MDIVIENPQELAQAEAAWRAAPTDFPTALNFAHALGFFGIDQALQVVQDAKPPENSPNSLAYYYHYIGLKQTANRLHRGQMPQHISSLDELFFPDCARERAEFEATADHFLRLNPDDFWAVSSKAICLFTAGRRFEAEPYYRRVKEMNPTADDAIFSPSFFKTLEALDTDKWMEGLPRMYSLVPQTFTDDNVMYLSCSIDYFVYFARTMLLSMADTAPGSQVHVHVMDGQDNDWAAVREFCAPLDLKIAISVERPGFDRADFAKARLYYHAIRFIRCWQHMNIYERTLWLMDVDALLNRSPENMFKGLGVNDMALRAAPARWELSSQFYAGVVAMRPTFAGRRYIGLAASYLASAWRNDRLHWGVDQIALYSVFQYLRDEGRAPAIHFLNERESDSRLFDEGVVWCNAGRRKFSDAKRISKGIEETGDARRDRYFSRLKPYADRL